MGLRLTILPWVVAGAAAGFACSGTSSGPSSPTTPSTGTGASGTCRTYPTSATVITTPSVGSSTMFTASFNPATFQNTITSLFAGGTVCTTTVHTYRSIADFVDEVRVIPPLALQIETTTTNSAACGSGTSSVTYSYDSQRRLTRFSTLGGTTTYTAWDASGRPTTGAESGGASLSYVYNDAARTLTLTRVSGGVASVSAITFDANGTNVLVVTSGASASTTTFAIAATDKVCK